MTMAVTANDASPSASARITFDQFDSYCRAYLARRDRLLSHSTSSKQSLSWMTYATGWRYDPPLYAGKAFEGTAGLSRSFDFLLPSHQPQSAGEEDQPVGHDDVVAAVEDDAAEQHPESSVEGARVVVTIHQSITLSSIWALPILHFHVTTHAGETVPLEQLSRLHIVHSLGSLPPEDEAGVVAAISVGDHPRTGLPSYYLHPCNTSQALKTLLAERDPAERQAEEQAEGRGWRYISTFISLCASAVEMRAS